jgi:HPr kinase/phosphorylase
MVDPGSAYAFTLVLDAVAGASCTHLFLHAAAVSIGDHTAVLVGPSGAGKSTLARAMAARGAVCLADDVTPLDVSTGALAFPGHSAPPRAGEQLLSPASVDHAFVLGPTPEPDRFHLAIDRFPREWRTVPPRHDVPAVVRRGKGYWEIEVKAVGTGGLATFARACREAGVLILRNLGQASSQFATATAIRPLEPVEGLPLLAAHVFGRGSRDTVQLIWDLGGAFSRASVWELLPGPPDEAAQAVSAVIGGQTMHSASSR